MQLKITLTFFTVLFFYAFIQAQPEEETLLLRSPSSSQKHIVFAYASDIWLADRNGNYPRRLTVHEGVEQNPVLSPDGRWVVSGGDDGVVKLWDLTMGRCGVTPEHAPTTLTEHKFRK